MKNRVAAYKKVIEWIYSNTINGNGIAVNSKNKRIYPEVTGYYIPSLIQWGERDLAKAYARYLCSIQKPDGSWYDSEDNAPYVFDSAQILKGLIAIRKIMPEVDDNIKQGCDWILTNMQEDGRLTTPNKDAWGDNEDFCSELIHIYCLSPIRDAGVIFHNKEYISAVEKILSYYKKNKIDKILNFSLLSHFYAYVMEGLFDLGEVELCRDAMENLEKYRNRKGGIPGLNDVPWVCSTGLFQLALVWYKLGDLQKGNSLFYYALELQNSTGGWYGSYPAPGVMGKLYRGRKKPYYFSDAEISWACKYFLDALELKEKLEFEVMSDTFDDSIGGQDGRYKLVEAQLANMQKEIGCKLKVCDVGCGKGRYLKRLKEIFPNNHYYASDISERVIQKIDFIDNLKIGQMTNLPFNDDSFDFVYSCEAFEHAINLKGAFNEMHRVTKKNGIFLILDKPVEKLGQLDIYEWEQWINDADIIKWSKELNCKLDIINSVSYDDKDDGLFRAWIMRKE